MKLSYVVVWVRDIERSLSFYRDLLDLEVRFRYSENDGTEVVFLVEKGQVPMKTQAMIELVTLPAAEEARPAGFLLGLEVASLEEKSALLLAHGYALTRGPYAPDDAFLISEFKGPDGEDVGLMQVDWAHARAFDAEAVRSANP